MARDSGHRMIPEPEVDRTDIIPKMRTVTRHLHQTKKEKMQSMTSINFCIGALLACIMPANVFYFAGLC